MSLSFPVLLKIQKKQKNQNSHEEVWKPHFKKNLNSFLVERSQKLKMISKDHKRFQRFSKEKKQKEGIRTSGHHFEFWVFSV